MRPAAVRVDRERAWQAMQRDKKARGGVPRLVLLGADGPERDVVLPEADVRRELDRLMRYARRQTRLIAPEKVLA